MSDKTIGIRATITLVDDPNGFLGAAAKVGDIISGSYTYDPRTPSSSPLSTVGHYRHTRPPYGISLNAGGLGFETDPADVDFLVELCDGHAGQDSYLIRSYKNRFAKSVPDDPLNPQGLNNIIEWQLDDRTASALRDVSLPSRPPKLADWTQAFGLTIHSSNDQGQRFMIRGVVNAVTMK